jgi:polysaccharide export outer membrane protein
VSPTVSIPWRWLLTALIGLALSGCQSTLRSEGLPSGAAAYEIAPPADTAAKPQTYRIGPGDTISVSVFQEPDLSNDKLQVDDVGRVQLPLAGDILAAGLTAPELSAVIAERLGRDYIRDPQVVVSVVSTRDQSVAVEGEVKLPGVYKISPSDTLLSAIARAQSPTNVARLDEIIVFRTVNGRRMGARFDLGEIRAGRAADPQILGGDVIVVGFSSLKGVYRDILTAAPLLNIFTQF